MKILTQIIIVSLFLISGVNCQENNITSEEGYTHLANYKKYKKFKKAIRNSDKVKYLDLSNQKLECIPSNISELLNLEVLNVSFNLIRSLPSEMFKLENLKVVYAISNL